MPIIVIGCIFAAFVALEVVLIRSWRGWWRRMAFVPAAAVALWAAMIIVSTILDPTSHNLWPFELVLWLAGAFAALGLMALIKRLARPHT